MALTPDSRGRVRVGAPISIAVVAMYIVLALLIVYATVHSSFTSNALVPEFLIGVIFLFLARYASTYYVLDDRALHARRLFGSRTVPLEEVRRVEFANLRDLGPVSFFGGWGWRGRMWSPLIHTFDSIHTISAGVLVTAGDYPLFISPKHPVEFGQELSRRVRSYSPSVGISQFAPASAMGA
ncbi:MAG: PH domain-containing protein [Thermoplasmata archaeon]|nr:PH domain-containing protein [Thermoplasmata archaeon]